MLELAQEANVNKDKACEILKELLNRISSRFTKRYLDSTEQAISVTDKYIIFPVEFFEPKNKTPIPSQVATFIFKLEKKGKSDYEISFQIENESVFYPVHNSINLNYFETLIDRVLLNKERMSHKLLLHTNFESTRMINLSGDNVKLYVIDEDEDVFSMNNSEFFYSDSYDFCFLEIHDIDKLIKILWKALINNNNNSEFINFEDFKILFEYGKLNFSSVNMNKLWKYCSHKKENVKYKDFALFCLDLFQCLRAYHKSFYKHENNSYFKKKIESHVNIMNLHFKEYDFNSNQEISYENLKKCLLKENELFTRKEIEIILKQINPDKPFEYWKFDYILKILFLENFDYQNLMKEDKIYNYLIKIFSKQDVNKTGHLHYRKMKQALLTENKLKLNKIQIMVILNFFNINYQCEVEYYKASLIIRDIIEELFSSKIKLQKIEIDQEKFNVYEHFEDEYDNHNKNIKEIFVRFDKNFDHLLNKDEYKEFLVWLIPFLDDPDINEIFEFTDSNKDNMISFSEFKSHFNDVMRMSKIKNVFKKVSNIL